MKRTSIQQLKKDFTIFPFPGLGKNTLVDFEFEIYDTKLRKARAKLIQLPDVVRNLKEIFSTSKETIEVMAKINTSIDSSKSSFRETKTSVMNLYEENHLLGIVTGFMILLVFILLSPILIIFALSSILYAVSILFISIMKKSRGLKNALGHVSPLSGNRIFIHNKGSDREERTISHEHCHLMQFNNNTLAEIIYNTNLNLEKLILENSPTSHERYLFSKLELEVRVHEFIRIIYYKNGEIPKSLDCFYREASSFIKKDLEQNLLASDLIICSHTISLSAYRHLQKVNEGNKDENKFLKLWGNIENELTDKYIIELLYPCYINLVRYYGYIDLSRRLGAEITGPNLYNFTYESSM